MESVIAIGVVAVLLTTFLAVFGPASQSIRRAISNQDADRLQSALERELQILREGPDDEFDTAFDKAFDWLLKSGDSTSASLKSENFPRASMASSSPCTRTRSPPRSGT